MGGRRISAELDKGLLRCMEALIDAGVSNDRITKFTQFHLSLYQVKQIRTMIKKDREVVAAIQATLNARKRTRT